MGRELVQQEERSGKSTPEYTAVRRRMETIIRALETDNEAKKTLCIKFKVDEWMDVIAKEKDIPPADLVTKALNKIEKSPISNYKIFYNSAG